MKTARSYDELWGQLRLLTRELQATLVEHQRAVTQGMAGSGAQRRERRPVFRV